jgi:DNA-binding MarR family transcriptional regulator
MSTMCSGLAAVPPARPRVTYLVKRLELAVRSHLDAVTGAYGLTTPQYAALSVLRHKSGVSSAALARMSFVSAQAMNEMVALLEAKNLIERRPDPNHKKIRQIFITDHGERVLKECEDAVDVVESRMLETLDSDEIDALTSMLSRCSAALSASS